jgi:hypothetical protein
VNELLIYAIMLNSLIVAYIQFVILLIEVKKVLSEELVLVCVARLPQSYPNELYQKTMDVSLTFLLHYK